MSNLSMRVVIGSMYVVAFALTVIIMIESTFHPRFLLLSSSGLYLYVLFIMVCSENLSL